MVCFICGILSVILIIIIVVVVITMFSHNNKSNMDSAGKKSTIKDVPDSTDFCHPNNKNPDKNVNRYIENNNKILEFTKVIKLVVEIVISISVTFVFVVPVINPDVSSIERIVVTICLTIIICLIIISCLMYSIRIERIILDRERANSAYSLDEKKLDYLLKTDDSKTSDLSTTTYKYK